MGGRASKNKGKVGERLLCTELREAFPHYAQDIRRGWQTRSGKDAADVEGLPGVHFEHKNEKRPSPLAALRQAIDDARPGNTPIAVLRQPRSFAVAILKWSDLLAMLVELDKKGKTHDSAPNSSDVPKKRRWLIRKH